MSKVLKEHTHIFTHNFLNIQLIFNPQKVLKSWDLGLSNHNIKCYLCPRLEGYFNLWHLQHAWFLTPLTWVTLLCIEGPVCTFDTSDIHSLLILYWYYSTVFHTFDMPFDLLLTVQYMTPSTPPTSKSHLIYNVDSNTKSSNYI